jgi:hypothetical protein
VHAYSAAKRIYDAKIYASVDDIPFKDKILSVSPDADPKVLEFFFRDMKRRALALDVPEINKQVTFLDVSFAIRRNSVPILLVNAHFLRVLYGVQKTVRCYVSVIYGPWIFTDSRTQVVDLDIPQGSKLYVMQASWLARANVSPFPLYLAKSYIFDYRLITSARAIYS